MYQQKGKKLHLNKGSFLSKNGEYLSIQFCRFIINMSKRDSYKFMNDRTFEEIYLKYFPRLLRFAREYVVSNEDAENITQDAFLILWEQRNDPKIHINLINYLYTLIKNSCIDHLRRKANAEKWKKRMQESYNLDIQMNLYSLEALDHAFIFHSDMEQIIARAIDSLPVKCREIFIRNKIDGKKYKEIAEEMQISVNTVENQISIALRKLREQLHDKI